MDRSGFLTPSRFKDIMTVAKGYKTKEELLQELAKLTEEQKDRLAKGRTKTKIFTDTQERLEQLPGLIESWNPASRFGDTALTYAKEIALGRFGVDRNEVTAKSLDHGNQFEPEAREAFENATGYFMPKEEFRMVSEELPFIAGEADGQIIGSEKKLGAEIKCPFNPVNHLDNILEGKQLEQYKWQVTGYCSSFMYGWDGYVFISYSPFFPGKGKLWYQEFERNEELEAELEDTLVLFEMDVVRPLVTELEELFETKQLEQWDFL